MRVFVNRAVVDMGVCKIGDTVQQEITNCLPLCDDCFPVKANQGYQGSFIATGTSLVNGLTGDWAIASNVFPGSTTPIPGVLFNAPDYLLSPASYPTVCNISDPSPQHLVARLRGYLTCITGQLTINVFIDILLDDGTFMCSLPRMVTIMSLTCPDPFNLTFNMDQGQIGDSRFGTGNLLFTFLQTHP